MTDIVGDGYRLISAEYLEMSRRRLDPVDRARQGVFHPITGDGKVDDLPLFAEANHE